MVKLDRKQPLACWAAAFPRQWNDYRKQWDTFADAHARYGMIGRPCVAHFALGDRCFDHLSGQQAYKCFACRISKAPLPKTAAEDSR